MGFAQTESADTDSAGCPVITDNAEALPNATMGLEDVKVKETFTLQDPKGDGELVETPVRYESSGAKWQSPYLAPDAFLHEEAPPNTDTNNVTGRDLASAKLIPNRGAWLEFEISSKNLENREFPSKNIEIGLNL